MPNRLCGEISGCRTKSGELCKFILPEGEDFCQHHNPDQSRRRKTIEKATNAQQNAKIHNIETNGFKSLDDCLAVRAEVVRICSKDKAVDFRRLDMILKATTGASADHATKATEKQNELLLALGGHGAGIAMLQRLREAPLRVLPGRRKALDVETVIEAVQEEQKEEEAS